MMVGGEGTSAAVEELVKGTRQVAEFVEQFRAYSESEKHWKARMEFILRHLPNYQDQPEGGRRLDQLLALSMVWANHLFLGCRCRPLPLISTPFNPYPVLTSNPRTTRPILSSDTPIP
ncbi:CDKN2AIP N-terminal-like protein isoform X1 [Antechinus flavipes]|uniref:CDKN2AIP N-terminal-like protein isoform X1 n=1 Tax=Antechinus flavipes TaxID=38775 RepID=UPI00223641DF|nr:CDKN2AIP N-terminal-like protein isoform X1 [Antechinus flavipes]